MDSICTSINNTKSDIEKHFYSSTLEVEKINVSSTNRYEPLLRRYHAVLGSSPVFNSTFDGISKEGKLNHPNTQIGLLHREVNLGGEDGFTPPIQTSVIFIAVLCMYFGRIGGQTVLNRGCETGFFPEIYLSVLNGLWSFHRLS